MVLCGKKKRYNTEAQAREMSNKLMNEEGEEFLRMYKCPLCDGWHLTHQVSDLERIYKL
jgi:hypothetical protein